MKFVTSFKIAKFGVQNIKNWMEIVCKTQKKIETDTQNIARNL